MRIISQNGEINLPFELTAVLSGGNDIVARLSGEAKKRVYVMASYSSVEKRRKAMKMMDNTYTGLFLAENMEMDAESANEMYKAASKGFGIIVTRANSVEMEFKPANIVFRFPNDDEI